MPANLRVSSSITLEKFTLSNKFVFDHAVARYTLYGELANGKKLALFFHGFSSSSDLHIWWQKFPIHEILKDYNIICFNSLGSCHGSLGPETICPDTGRPYAERFPEISIVDTINFIISALKKMNIQKLDLVFGCSLGGMQALDMFIRFPMMADKFISVCGSPLPFMTNLTNAAQSNILESGIKNNLSKDTLKSYMGLARFFFRLSCTTEKALSLLD
jgi:homoserine acetyltransferase